MFAKWNLFVWIVFLLVPFLFVTHNSALERTADYPCIGEAQNMTLPADQVCDGTAQCPLHDDEYYCEPFQSYMNHLFFSIGEGTDKTCCQQILCLSKIDALNWPPLMVTTFGKGFGKAYGRAGRPTECMYQKRHPAITKCDEDITKLCPLGCSCCPLVISCNGSSWSQMVHMLRRRPSDKTVTVRTLKITNMVEAADRDWSQLAGIFPYLRFLYISNTLLSLKYSEFAALVNLDVIALIRDGIEKIETDNFRGLTNLAWLALEENNITSLDDAPFSHLNVNHLSLFNNPLSNIGHNAWNGVGPNIQYLRLDNISLSNVTKTTFNNLKKSTLEIDLKSAGVTRIEPGAFLSTPNIVRLLLTGNRLERLQPNSFIGPGERLADLGLTNNPIRYIDAGAFAELSGLKFLSMRKLPDLQFNKHMFNGLNLNVTLIETDNHGVCCLAGKANCLSKTPAVEFNDCGRLFPNPLWWIIWIMAIFAITGNVIVIALRYRRKNESSSQNVQRVLILNLAISDLLMGIYMLILAAVDVHYDTKFYWYSEQWRTESNLCQFAGFLVLVSCETSVFIITTISIDRFVIINFPFARRRLRGPLFHVTLVIIWVISLMIASIAILGKKEKMYGQSNVCIGLPLVKRYISTSGYTFYETGENKISADQQLFSEVKGPAWTLSIVVFLGINFICLLIVLFCYIAIFFSVRKSRQTASRDPERNEEIRMAFKMSLIVGTDFFCWMPIVLLGIITQSSDNVELSTQVYAWIIVFILPINSAVNPYIYSVNSALDFRKRRLSRRTSSMTGTFRLTRLLSYTKDDGNNGSNNNTSLPASPNSARSGCLTNNKPAAI